MSATADNTALFEAYKAAINSPELTQARRTLCRSLSGQLVACGERLWAFGCGGPDFRTALSIVIQFGGSLSTGAVTLAEDKNWYTASAVVRQFIEVEYLVRLFRRRPEEAVSWLRSSEAELRDSFTPSAMRKRLGDFRNEEYRAHCQFGGHPNPRAQFLLPVRDLTRQHGPFESNAGFWIDLAQHLRRVWRDIEDIPTDHPRERLDAIFQYTDVVTDAINTWAEIDPCSPMISEVLLRELVAGAKSPPEAGGADHVADD